MNKNKILATLLGLTLTLTLSLAPLSSAHALEREDNESSMHDKESDRGENDDTVKTKTTVKSSTAKKVVKKKKVSKKTPTKKMSPAKSPVSTRASSTPATPAAKTVSMADIATHNSATSCWTAINGNGYDLTDWINKHPGGSRAILSLCGKDGTTAFNNQHGGQGRPERELANYLIGAVK